MAYVIRNSITSPPIILTPPSLDLPTGFTPLTLALAGLLLGGLLLLLPSAPKDRLVAPCNPS